MKCHDFESQLNAALDEPAATSALGELSSHARTCPACQAIWRSYEALLASVAQLPPLRAPRDLGSRVLAELKRQPAAPTPSSVTAWRWMSATLAIAAALLIAAWGLFSSPGTRDQVAHAPAALDSTVDPTAVEIDTPQLDDHAAPPVELRELALLVPGVGDSAESATEVAAESTPWLDQVSTGVKPLAESTGSVLDLLIDGLAFDQTRP